ncbi:MAG: S-methyl-5'-thioadenosine phosphorylase [Alicyclobacillaceae bacterium]|nr:S-methyl-5'-thioadenosine phosphorylase [Alicyclobacillaceae bacterium]
MVDIKADYAIIGGTGVYDPRFFVDAIDCTIETPYGNATATIGTYGGKRVAFLARHGTGHQVPPHLVNYRANIYALHTIGVQTLCATAAVGSLRPDLTPGSLLLADDFLDFTKSRPATFTGPGAVTHADMTDPYCPGVRARISKAAAELGHSIHPHGTYVCTEGPRFETAAEIRFYSGLGASVVGMTSVPEVVLARELGMCYATICIVTNFATGISGAPLTHKEVVDTMSENINSIRDILAKWIDEDTIGDNACHCRDHIVHDVSLHDAASSS